MHASAKNGSRLSFDTNDLVFMFRPLFLILNAFLLCYRPSVLLYYSHLMFLRRICYFTGTQILYFFFNIMRDSIIAACDCLFRGGFHDCRGTIKSRSICLLDIIIDINWCTFIIAQQVLSEMFCAFEELISRNWNCLLCDCNILSEMGWINIGIIENEFSSYGIFYCRL